MILHPWTPWMIAVVCAEPQTAADLLQLLYGLAVDEEPVAGAAGDDAVAAIAGVEFVAAGVHASAVLQMVAICAQSVVWRSNPSEVIREYMLFLI